VTLQGMALMRSHSASVVFSFDTYRAYAYISIGAKCNRGHYDATSARIAYAAAVLQTYRPLQQITWPCRPTGEAPLPSQAPPSITVFAKL